MPKPDDSNLGQYLGYGLQIGVGVALGAWVGNWLDQKYHWSPWGILVGASLGLASGMYMLIRDAMRMNKD